MIIPPFKVKLSRELNFPIKGNEEEILKIIAALFLKRNAKEIRIINNGMTFKHNIFSAGSLDTLLNINEGKVSLCESQDRPRIIYEFKMIHILLFISVFFVITYLTSESWISPVIVCGVLLGIGCLVPVIRQNYFLKEIVSTIETQIIKL